MRLEEELLRKAQGPRPTPDFCDGRAARWPVSSWSAGSAREGGRSLRGERGRELPGRRGCSESRRCWRGAAGSGPPFAIAGALENRGRERAPTPVSQERAPTDRGERGRSVPRGRGEPNPLPRPPAASQLPGTGAAAGPRNLLPPPPAFAPGPIGGTRSLLLRGVRGSDAPRVC